MHAQHRLAFVSESTCKVVVQCDTVFAARVNPLNVPSATALWNAVRDRRIAAFSILEHGSPFFPLGLAQRRIRRGCVRDSETVHMRSAG